MANFHKLLLFKRFFFFTAISLFRCIVHKNDIKVKLKYNFTHTFFFLTAQSPLKKIRFQHFHSNFECIVYNVSGILKETSVLFSSVQFKMVSMRSAKHICAPLHPVSQEFPQCLPLETVPGKETSAGLDGLGWCPYNVADVGRLSVLYF